MPSAIAPAASVGPSVPSVPAAEHDHAVRPRRCRSPRPARIPGCGPPRPLPCRVTVVSPPDDDARRRASPACPKAAPRGRSPRACAPRRASRPRSASKAPAGGSPSSLARFRAAASTARRLLPTTRLVRARECRVVRPWAFPGSRRDARSRCAPARTPGCGRRCSYLSRIARAPAKVEASGAVGPEPITSRSSPITSESSSDSTVAGIGQPRQLPALDLARCASAPH